MMDPTRIVRSSSGPNSGKASSNSQLIKFLILSVPYQLKKSNESEIETLEWGRVKDR